MQQNCTCACDAVLSKCITLLHMQVKRITSSDHFYGELRNVAEQVVFQLKRQAKERRAKKRRRFTIRVAPNRPAQSSKQVVLQLKRQAKEQRAKKRRHFTIRMTCLRRTLRGRVAPNRPAQSSRSLQCFHRCRRRNHGPMAGAHSPPFSSDHGQRF
jgi:hypothetical protein